jgi:predicted RNase H-like nuclease (RuvC/YqgF family)
MQISNNVHVRLSGYVDDLATELEQTEKKLETEQAEVKKLTTNNARLQRTIDNSRGANCDLYNEVNELHEELHEVKIKNEKNKRAGQKLEALRSMWTGITGLLSPEVEEESGDECSCDFGGGNSDEEW